MLNKLARSLLSAVLFIFLVGFGVCGATGIVTGWSNGGWGLLVMGLVGIAVAWLCWAGIARLWRKRPPEGK